MRFPPELDVPFLRLAVTEVVVLVHEDRGYAIGEGASRVDMLFLLTAPPAPGKETRFFKEANLRPPGSWNSIAKPTKSEDGFPFFQFIAIRVMPSPLCSLKCEKRRRIRTADLKIVVHFESTA